MVLLMAPVVHNPFVAEVFTAPLRLRDDMVDVRFCWCREPRAAHCTRALLSFQQRLFLFG